MKLTSIINNKFTLILLSVIVFYSCQKDIDIKIPEVESKIVVEGFIESGSIPIVMISKSIPYFDETNAEDLFGSFIHDAIVNVTVDGSTTQLQEVCSSQIPDSLLPFFMQLTGIVAFPGSTLDICIYTDLTFSVVGEENKTYRLDIDVEGEALKAYTTIPPIVSLDSVWFEAQPNLDSLGFAWARISDPDTLGNAYRWSAQRISHYPDGSIKDPVYIPPFNSATDDKFFNGLSFEFSSSRGILPFSDKEDDTNEEAFFFKVGDTIAVKGLSISQETYLFLRSYYTEVSSQGSPFANPASLISNVEGGLGIWAGYGVYNDTIYATE